MSIPENLQDLYIDELKDLWSANDQMLKCIKKITSKAADKSLKEMLTKSQEGILKHTAVLKVFDQRQLDAVAAQLNARPRLTLGFETPADTLAAHVLT